MKRPADQAKLLFLYLLRSSAAALANNSNHLQSSSTGGGHICLRLARLADVPNIQRCNLATLPENYNAQFYTQHLRQFPDLALVAEHVVSEESHHQTTHRTFPGMSATTSRMSSSSSNNNNNNNNNNNKIVGYILGKVEDRSMPYCHERDRHTNCRTYMDLAGNAYKLEPTGHVTSLAVLDDYRRRGVAASLLQQLHAHLHSTHQVDCVGLHVRQGNQGATQLYRRQGYNVQDVLDHYYADGEPAYLMRKPFPQQEEQPGGMNRVIFGGTRSVKPWKGNGPFALPRTIWTPPYEKDDATVREEEEVEVMTGT